MGDQKLDAEEKKKLTELFKRMADFGIDFEEETTEGSEEDSLDALAEMDSDLDEAKLEAILGTEMFAKFRDFIKKDACELTYTPWWKQDTDDEAVLVQDVSSKQPKPLMHEDIPSFRSISKTQPSEFLWNNLFEILFLYTYSMSLYLGDLESSRPEVVQAMLLVSGILSGKIEKYDSTPQAITSALNNIKQNPTINNPDIFAAGALKELILLMREPINALHAVCHLRRLFEDMTSPPKDVFLASKKLLYYSSWLHSELTDNQDLVDEIFSSVVLILGGIHDRLLRKHTN